MPPEFTDETTDEELVAAAQQGDARGAKAYEVLVKRHQSWLVRYVTHLLGNQSDAEDIAQEAFVRGFLAIKNFRGETSLRGWIRVIATRLAFNYRRDSKSRTQKHASLEIDPYVMNGSGPVMAKDSIEKVLDQISYPFREILILRHVEELSIEQISMVLEIGKSATKMRLSRARSQFWDAYGRMVAT